MRKDSEDTVTRERTWNGLAGVSASNMEYLVAATIGNHLLQPLPPLPMYFPEYPLIDTDAGRSLSHPKEKRDCVVRAVALAFNIPYKDALQYAGSVGRIAGHGTTKEGTRKVIHDLCEMKNMRLLKHSFPAKKGHKRMNVLEFCKTHPQGTYITQQAGHVATVIDGKLHDCGVNMYSWERCVYTAFEIIPTPTNEQ